MNPKISMYDYVYGPYDYNVDYFVPIEMETLVHDNPNRRGTFAEHCSKGFVLVTAFEHYRSCVIWMKDTKATRISDTVFHKNKYITNLEFTPKDRVIAAARKLADTLKGRMPPHLSENILEKLERIRTILKHECTQTVHTNPPMIPPHRTHPAYIPF